MYKKKVKKDNDPNTLIKASVERVERPRPTKIEEKKNTKSFLWKRGESVLNLFKETYNAIKYNKPLMIGVSKILQEKHPVIPKRLINTAMYIHTRSKPYLVNLTKSTTRIDLDNQPTETINKECVDKAKILLTQLYKVTQYEKPRSIPRQRIVSNKERIRRK